MAVPRAKPRWRRGWPMKPGNYFLRLSCGDIVAMNVRRDVGEIDGHELRGVEACDSMDGVFFIPPDVSPLEKYWGKALAHFGPIPKYRTRNG